MVFAKALFLLTALTTVGLPQEIPDVAIFAQHQRLVLSSVHPVILLIGDDARELLVFTATRRVKGLSVICDGGKLGEPPDSFGDFTLLEHDGQRAVYAANIVSSDRGAWQFLRVPVTFAAGRCLAAVTILFTDDRVVQDAKHGVMLQDGNFVWLD